MTAPTLATSLLAAESVHEMRVSLAIRSVLGDFPTIRPDSRQEQIDWGKALTVASALTSEDQASAQDLALRVAQGCLLSDDAQQNQLEAAGIILERMGNRLALQLAVQRQRIDDDMWTEAPAPLQLEVLRRRLELAIPLTDDRTFSANPFQRRFWTAVQQARRVSVSAPTSAGKSYIVRRWFEEVLSGRECFTGVYVVPTRALIEEVSAELVTQFVDLDVGIFTLPWDADLAGRARKILVLTQERLHLLQQRLPDLMTDLLFVDEAQKVGDGARGVLLQQTIEETRRRSPDTQIVFASPLTSNPELLLDDTGQDDDTSVVESETITVNQNLLWANQVPYHPSLWKLQLVLDGRANDVGEFSLPARPQPESKRLPLVAVALGRDTSGNVVYVNGPGAAETTALQIHAALGPEADMADDAGIAALRDLVQRTIHADYRLATVLQRGIAFHYGNMPLLVRSEIERLFRDGKLRYLVCTSTLLEGVNLPCRNLFARNPKKGNGKPMSAADFWNLAGRAGRWGKEFQGNIVCVDANRPERWPELPTTRHRRPIARATTEALSDPGAVVSFIENGAPVEAARAHPMLETVYSYLASRVLTNAGLDELSELGPDDAAKLDSAIRSQSDRLEIAPALIQRHAGISPASMQRLLDRFRTYESIEDTVLAPPESTDATTSYARAFALSSDELGGDFGASGRQFQLALLITQWMRGYPLARLIAERIRYLESHEREYKLPNEIRGVMQDVEQVARFQAPKYLACYSDVLTIHLRQQDVGEAPQMPDISMMLELGVSRMTEVSLMALGLSRTSAVALSEFIVADDLGREDAAQWVMANRTLWAGLPALVRREIDRSLGDGQTRSP
jgi:DEAD/DEAH box helicase/Helicase conserved C-terminal domain